MLWHLHPLDLFSLVYFRPFPLVLDVKGSTVVCNGIYRINITLVFTMSFARVKNVSTRVCLSKFWLYRLNNSTVKR